MRNANRFKLGLFSVNADGGTAFTKVANRWRADWNEIEMLAKVADSAGLEFICRLQWMGYGGRTEVRAASFETLTHAAAVAAITRRVAIFATIHVPLLHPVFAAKALMTIDHVSRGRAGLNIVCGWNQEEFDMFGHRQPEHDDRYRQGHEWFSILLRIFTSEARFDHEGEFYALRQVIGMPAPVQRPRPVTLSARSRNRGHLCAFGAAQSPAPIHHFSRTLPDPIDSHQATSAETNLAGCACKLGAKRARIGRHFDHERARPRASLFLILS